MKILNPKDLNENVFRMFDDSWCLIASYDKNHTPLPYNAMTASWGGMGVLWNKNVLCAVIRPQRYTKQFVDREELYTLCFFEIQPGQAALSYRHYRGGLYDCYP